MHDYDASRKLWILDDAAHCRSGANAVALLSAGLSDTLHSFAYVVVMNGRQGRRSKDLAASTGLTSFHFLWRTANTAV